jgi:hypothetical protein
MEENKLPAEFKAKWIAALRSGEYKQGTNGNLLNPITNEYCCLGVACRVAGFHPREVRASAGEFIDSNTEHLPAILRGFNSNTIPFKLAQMNDGNNGVKQHSFSEIADYIEQNL